MPDYMARADDSMICMITIEHIDAVNRIGEIMATPGIDIAVIGVGDLATSIGKRGQPGDPEVQALVAKAEAGILEVGVPLGGAALNAEMGNAMIERAMWRWRWDLTGHCSSAESPPDSRASGGETAISRPILRRNRPDWRYKPAKRQKACLSIDITGPSPRKPPCSRAVFGPRSVSHPWFSTQLWE